MPYNNEEAIDPWEQWENEWGEGDYYHTKEEGGKY